jgi:hypothetical protein
MTAYCPRPWCSWSSHRSRTSDLGPENRRLTRTCTRPLQGGHRRSETVALVGPQPSLNAGGRRAARTWAAGAQVRRHQPTASWAQAVTRRARSARRPRPRAAPRGRCRRSTRAKKRAFCEVESVISHPSHIGFEPRRRSISDGIAVRRERQSGVFGTVLRFSVRSAEAGQPAYDRLSEQPLRGCRRRWQQGGRESRPSDPCPCLPLNAASSRPGEQPSTSCWTSPAPATRPESAPKQSSGPRKNLCRGDGVRDLGTNLLSSPLTYRLMRLLVLSG